MKSVRIHKQSKTATQSGKAKTNKWIMTFAGAMEDYRDDIVGWSASMSTENQIEISFPSLMEAEQFAVERGYQYVVEISNERVVTPKSYSDNFKFDHLS